MELNRTKAEHDDLQLKVHTLRQKVNSLNAAISERMDNPIEFLEQKMIDEQEVAKVFQETIEYSKSLIEEVT